METNKACITVRVHKTGEGTVIGACDAHLVGKKLKEGALTLDISERFYSERETTAEELVSLIENCLTANLVGEKTVEAYCKSNPDARDCIKRIGKVPHLQVFSL